MDTDLTAAYDRCRELHKRHGRTYYLATRLLPAWKRRHVHALYGFTRYADEIVDRTEDLPPAERAARLDDWASRFVAGLHGAPVDDPLLPAVLHTIAVFDLDRDDFASFLRSMAMDLTVTAYPTYDDLLDYMEGSAAVIGTMMLPILGSSDPAAAREPARQLGFAFQLTNFIRDVAEDLDRGRTYLPDEDLAKFGVTREDLLAARAARPQHAADPRADRVRGDPRPGALRRRRAGHHRARARLAGLHAHRVRALRRHPRRGRPRRTTTSSSGGPWCRSGAGWRWPRGPCSPRPARRSPSPGRRIRAAEPVTCEHRRSSLSSPATCGCTTTRRWPPPARRFERVVPLFVLDPALPTLSANRTRFLHQASPTCATRCASAAATWWSGTATRWPRRSGWPARSAPRASRSPPTSAATPAAGSGGCARSASGTGIAPATVPRR